MHARQAAFKLGGEPWYGYWYGVIRQVVGGMSTGLETILRTDHITSSRLLIGHLISNPQAKTGRC